MEEHEMACQKDSKYQQSKVEVLREDEEKTVNLQRVW